MGQTAWVQIPVLYSILAMKNNILYENCSLEIVMSSELVNFKDKMSIKCDAVQGNAVIRRPFIKQSFSMK